MRVTLVMWLSLVLAWMPGFQQAGAAEADGCVSCSCRQVECCPPAAPGQPVPASPASSVPQQQSQSPAGLPVTAVSFSLPPLVAAGDFAPSAVSLSFPAVPLYQRHCTFLI